MSYYFSAGRQPRNAAVATLPVPSKPHGGYRERLTLSLRRFGIRDFQELKQGFVERQRPFGRPSLQAKVRAEGNF